MVFFQTGHRTCFLPFDMPITMLSVITSRMPDGRTGDIHVKPYIQRILPFTTNMPEMRFSYMDCLISGLLQDTRQSRCLLRDAIPVPIPWPERRTVVAFRIDPVCRAMACGILPRHDGSTRRRTYALGIKSRKTDSLPCHPFHIGCPIPIIQRMTERISILICQKRQ